MVAKRNILPLEAISPRPDTLSGTSLAEQFRAGLNVYVTFPLEMERARQFCLSGHAALEEQRLAVLKSSVH